MLADGERTSSLRRRIPRYGCRSRCRPAPRVARWPLRSAPAPPSRRKWAAPRAVLARPSRSRHISTSRFRRRPAAGDSPACRYSRDDVPLPWPDVGLAGWSPSNGPSPAPVAQARASNSRLTRSSWRTWPQRTAQEGSQGGWRLDRAAQGAGRPSGAQRIGVVNAVAASQRGSDQGHHLVAGVGPARGVTQIQALLHQQEKGRGLGSPGAAAQHWPPGGGRHLDAVGVVAW